MSAFTIRAIKDDEVESYVTTMFWAAGRPVDTAFIAEQRSAFSLARAFAAFDGKELVGTIGTRSLSMTLVGGAHVPIAAIGQGGVLPTHARKGAMRALMLRSLDAAREHEEPLAAWTTSEWPLYERYGGGPATFSAAYRLRALGRSTLRRPIDVQGRVRMITHDEALNIVPELHHRAARRQPGGVPRDLSYWERAFGRLKAGTSLDVLESRRDLPAALFCASVDGENCYDGLCVYRVHQRFEAGLFQSEMEILYFIVASHDAEAALWSLLMGTDLVSSIFIGHAPVENPLRWLLKDGRRMETVGSQDHVWLRLLDPVAVLGSRWFTRLHLPLTVKIHDPSGAPGDMTIEIHSDGVRTEVTTTSAIADVEMEIGTLSSLVLNGNNVWNLAAAGRIVYASYDSLVKAAIAFANTEPAFTDTSF